jgi:signal transduction histidine kinase
MLCELILNYSFPLLYPNIDDTILRIFSTSVIPDEILLTYIFFILILVILAGFIFMVFLKNKRLKGDLDEKSRDLQEAFEIMNENNKQLQTANKELIKKNIQQKEFINTAAHELRTPTQAITGYIELIDELLKEVLSEKVVIVLREEGKEKNALQLSKYQELVLRNATRLSDLINDLLDVARIDISGDNIRLNEENVDLIKEINDFLIDFRTSRKKSGKDYGIIINFDTALVSDKPLSVRIDRLRFGQILNNILSNAIKYSDENSTITISIAKLVDYPDYNQYFRDKNKNMVVLRVKDEGKGIFPDILPKIFDRFVTNSESGTGLGLYITKKIIEAHGGSIWCYNNRDGKGSTFEFTVPLSG